LFTVTHPPPMVTIVATIPKIRFTLLRLTLSEDAAKAIDKGLDLRVICSEILLAKSSKNRGKRFKAII
jgi:hypothetical protein